MLRVSPQPSSARSIPRKTSPPVFFLVFFCPSLLARKAKPTPRLLQLLAHSRFSVFRSHCDPKVCLTSAYVCEGFLYASLSVFVSPAAFFAYCQRSISGGVVGMRHGTLWLFAAYCRHFSQTTNSETKGGLQKKNKHAMELVLFLC